MSPLDIYEPPHGDRVKGAEHPRADPLAQVQECTVAPLPCLRVVTIPKECISSMWIVVWPIFSSSLNSMQRVATGVEDCPKLAHHGRVQVGMRELTVLPLCSHDVLGHELCTTGLSVHGQCSAAPADKLLATMSSSASASSSGSGRTRGKEGVVFRLRLCSSAVIHRLFFNLPSSDVPSSCCMSSS